MEQHINETQSQRSSNSSIVVQDDISITIRPASAITRNLILFLIAAMGLIGTIYASLSMFTPVYDRKKFLFAATIAFLGYSFLSMLPKRLRWLTPVSLAVATIFFFWKRRFLIAGFQFFYNHLYQNIYHTEVVYYRIDAQWNEAQCTTFFLTGCVVFLICLVCWFTIHRPFFPIGFLVTFLPIELGLYNGLEMSLPAMAMVLLYWTALIAMQLTAMRYSQEQRDVGFFRKGNRFTAAYTMRTTMAERCGIIMAFLTALVFLLSWALLTASGIAEKPEIQEKRKELKTSLQAFDMEDVQDSLFNLGAAMGFGNTMRMQKLGRKSSVDIQNEPQLKLTLDALPNHAVYLKSFTGTTYDDNAWKALDTTIWEENESLTTLSKTYNCYPQLFPYWFETNRTESAVTNIDISALKWERYCYTPYAAYNEKAAYQEDSGTIMDNKKNYSFSLSTEQNFSELLSSLSLQTISLQRSMFNAEDDVTTKFLDALSLPKDADTFSVTTYANTQKTDGTYDQHAIQSMLTEQYVYRPFVYANYTEKKETDALQAVYDCLPDSVKYATCNAGISEESLRNGNGESLSDQLSILEDIRKFLADHATYSTSPGKTPGSRDFVNYFLLENHQGYCTHFATAGVLLARYAGIPARYCEGYVATPSDFEKAVKQKDGYEVKLTDARAHAWCEFYVTGYGWIPFEFTPGYYGGEEPPEPEVTATTATQTELVTTTIQTMATVTQTTATVQTTLIYSGTDPHASGGQSHSNASDSPIGRILLKILLVLILLTAILAAPFLIRMCRIKKRMEQFQSTNRAKAVLSMYSYWEQLLAFIGISAGNQPILTFARFAAQQLQEKQLPAEQTASFCLLVSAVDMGGKTPSEEERTMALHMLQQLADAIYQSSKPLQKLYMKYIKHFI